MRVYQVGQTQLRRVCTVSKKIKHYHQPASSAVDAAAATDDAVVQRRLVDDL